MVKAWYMNDDPENPSLEHHLDPPKYIGLEDLYKVTGVEYFQFNSETYKTDGKLDAIREQRNYSYEDEITCSEQCLPDFKAKLKTFFQEHLHTEEEIRFVLDGSGYFDDATRRTGGYGYMSSRGHDRYSERNLSPVHHGREDVYKGEEVLYRGSSLDPHNRPADDMECRKEYVQKLIKGF